MRIRWLFLIAFFLGVVLPVAAIADDLIVSRAVLQDRAGTLTIDDVTQADFSPIGPMLTGGYTDAVHWLRIVIKAPAPGAQIELRIRPTYLDEVRLYAPDPAQSVRWLSRATGDRVGYALQDRPAVTLGFALALHAPLTTVYLRLETTSSSLLNVEALTPHEARTKDVHLDVFLTIYLGFMVALLFWAANDYAIHRQRVVGLFLIYQACYSVYVVAVMGYLAVLLPQVGAGMLDTFTSTLVCLAPAVSLFFHRVLLGQFLPPRRALRVLEALVFMGLLALTMLALGYTRQALQFNSLIILLAAPTFVALAFIARLNAPPGLRVIRIVYSLQGLSLVISMLPFLGWVTATEWSLQATLLHGLISAFLMFLLLHLRSRELSRQAAQVAMELEVTHEQLAAKLLQKQQQERFVAMLTHELKTPMAVIHMALGSLKFADTTKRRAVRALADMTAVVEHCQQADQLEQQQLAMRAVLCSIEESLAEHQTSSGAPQRIVIDTAALPSVMTDPQLLRIVLDNLVNNALKYAAPGSLIHLQALPCVHEGKPGVRVCVRNQVGPAGLPDADKVFDKYYRSPGAHRKTGSGLGLYLVKSYMQLLGGYVGYAVVADEVEFSIWMPC